MFESTVFDAHGDVEHASYLHVGVECEIAVRLRSGIDGASAGREDLLDAVGSAMAAIEIVDDRFRDYTSISTPTVIADDFFGAGCVLGPPNEDVCSLDLKAVSGGMRINGESVGQGRGEDILGDPINALAWLSGELAAQGIALRAGEFVLLGSLVQTVWVKPGDRVEVAIEGLGGASLSFR